ncbi:twin-arginine translocation signal domain-containing protein [Amphritea opalescens]|uniref:Twin-arginine translocation signal domain-containing protein n=1 Tax=Amphritea opalescens TaxID=2490544 RepID=A0A430KLC9_9GAMM|nr:thiosulfate oxidation carrier protein SoxY [Amphritea opalescens]RTE64280.1 twin-arginine translocation signal domain-containing protein [Amphritea opalescens]
MMNRRAVIKAITSCGALLGIGVLLPRQVLAEWNQAAFAAETQAEAIKLMFGAEPVVSDEVHLKLPMRVADGMSVPVSVITSLPNVESISLFIEGSENPLVAEFILPARAQGEVLTRIRIPQTSTVTAVVKTGEQLLSASQEAKISSGDCG